jgi:hypothetical protein
MDQADKKITKLFELNKRLSEEIQSSLPSIIDSLGKTKFKYTSKALLSFIPKSGYLNSAILELVASKNIYASAILYRSIIEHSFRHLYIYMKSLKEDSDNIGQTYCNTLKGAEDLQYFDKVNKHNKSVDPDATIWNTKNDHNKKIRKTQDEFKFSKIVEYFKSDQNHVDSVKEYINSHLLERSVEYDNLSSAVHGGPFGESALFNLHKDKEKHDATLFKFAHESMGLHHSIVESTYLFAYVVVSNDMKEHYEKIKSLRDSEEL